MVTRWALVRMADSVVDNVIEYDGVAEYQPPLEMMLIDAGGREVGPGFLYDALTGEFIDPNPPAPDVP